MRSRENWNDKSALGPMQTSDSMSALGQQQTYDRLNKMQTRTWSNNRVDCKAGAATLSGLLYLFIYAA